MIIITFFHSYTQKNVNQQYPLHCVIESKCLDNLKEVSSLFSYYDFEENPHQLKDSAHTMQTLKYSPYVNVKDQSAKNSLHILAESLSADSYEVIFPMMKMLISHGCNANYPDHEGLTPIYIVLERFTTIKEAKIRREILDYFLTNANIDFYTHRSEEIIEMIMNQKLKFQLPEVEEFEVNFESMVELLKNGDINTFETKFLLFKSFCADSEMYAECCAIFLGIAVMRSLVNIVDLLIDFGVKINKIPKGLNFLIILLKFGLLIEI